MIQGTGSHVGKSILAAGFCRILADRGYKVAPFKSQNMSLNSAVTIDGGEIARAQELQARGARVEPSVLMNPVLLKPKDAERCEVIMLGKSIGDFTPKQYLYDVRERALRVIKDSLENLREEFELVVIEGGGSPAEVNLRELDLCNMKVAEMAGAPVLLVADIDTGGALASVVGTFALLNESERKRIKGIIINKFRGDLELLEPALPFLETKTGCKVLGVLPFIDCSYLDEEDTLSDYGTAMGEAAVIKLPYLSNFTDFEPLSRELPLKWAKRPEDLDGAKVVIIPGTRNTMHDLAWLKENGFADSIKARAADGTIIIGICGGYQMLGEKLIDSGGVESGGGEHEGLCILPITTRYERPKSTNQVTAKVVEEIPALPGLVGTRLQGYEIHTGRVEVRGATCPLLFKSGGESTPDGAISTDGRVFGTHLHGLFDNQEVIKALLSSLEKSGPAGRYRELAEQNIARLARVMEESLDMEYVYDLLEIQPDGQEVNRLFEMRSR